MEDSRIVDLYWQRDEGAISASAEKYGKYCNHIAYNILYSSEDAEECVNDTWLRAWNAIPPQRPVQLSTYLGKITRNLALNKCKSANAKKRGGGQTAAALAELEECIAGRSHVEDFIDESVLTEAINSFLRGLPKVNRVIFVKRYWYMTPVKEIAAELSMRENRVATMLFRMRKELKACLEKEDIQL